MILWFTVRCNSQQWWICIVIAMLISHM